MAHRWAVVIVCVVVVASTVPIYMTLGVNFVPDEDESRFQVSVRLPVGSSLAATQSMLDRIARDLREQLPGVSDTLGIVGFGGAGGQANQGTVFTRLKPPGTRPSQQALVARARKLIQPYRGEAVVGVQGTSGIVGVGGRGAAIQYSLVGPDLAKLDRVHGARTRDHRQEPARGGRRPQLCAGHARAARGDRPLARGRPRRPRAGRVRDGQRPDGGPARHDLQFGERPVRRPAEGAAGVPPRARDAGRRHRARPAADSSSSSATWSPSTRDPAPRRSIA